MSVFDIVTGSQSQNAGSSIANALVTKRPTANAAQANAASTTTDSGTGAATITSNDFMVLLVSELKNQDPTQPTDPNAYITQMVGVNSLQQLISINQGITTLEPTTTTKATGSVTSGPVANVSPTAAPQAIAASSDATAAAQIRSAALASMNLT